MRRLRNLFIGLFLLFGLLWGGYYLLERFSVHHPQTSSDVLLEQIRDVAKLVTNEGDFMEIYAYEDYWGYDISPLRKKALVRATGHALVGFDLDQIEMDIREDDRIIVLGRLPQPDILALEVEIDYYDLTQGTFNAFEAADLTRIETDVRAKMHEKVIQSDLFRQARVRMGLFYNTITALAEQTGWTIRYKDQLHLYALPRS